MALKAGYKGIKKIGTGLKLTTEGTLSLSGSGPAGEIELNDLSDVDITTPSDGQILQYDSTSQKWVNTIQVPIPNGSSVTPTDDIQIWLHCAGIYNKSYTLLSEILADSTTLLALISNNNAVDYMKRSTTWASAVTANSTAMSYIGANDYCAVALLDDSTWRTAICNSTYFESVLNVKVPTMTSDTTPSGEAFGSNPRNADYKPFRAFNGLDKSWSGTSNYGYTTVALPGDVGYDFGTAVAVSKAWVVFRYDNTTKDDQTPQYTKLQYSSDRANWTDASETLKMTSPMPSVRTQQNLVVTTNIKARYWRLYFFGTTLSGRTDISSLNEAQFYGRA